MGGVWLGRASRLVLRDLGWSSCPAQATPAPTSPSALLLGLREHARFVARPPLDHRVQREPDSPALACVTTTLRHDDATLLLPPLSSCRRLTPRYRPPALPLQSKNHTNHNQNKKAHKNGIKKPKLNRHPSMNGVDPKVRPCWPAPARVPWQLLRRSLLLPCCR
jgi:hypothetical protein